METRGRKELFAFVSLFSYSEGGSSERKDLMERDERVREERREMMIMRRMIESINGY